MLAMAEPTRAAATAATPARSFRTDGELPGCADSDDFNVSGPSRRHSHLEQSKLRTWPRARTRPRQVRSSDLAVTARAKLSAIARPLTKATPNNHVA
jgi:hypothetical protein